MNIVNDNALVKTVSRNLHEGEDEELWFEVNTYEQNWVISQTMQVQDYFMWLTDLGYKVVKNDEEYRGAKTMDEVSFLMKTTARNLLKKKDEEVLFQVISFVVDGVVSQTVLIDKYWIPLTELGYKVVKIDEEHKN